MPKSLSAVLTTYGAKIVRRGPEDETRSDSYPGVCALAREVRPDEYMILDVLTVDRDVLSKARILLKHPFPAGESYVVMVLPIADEALRVQASMDLAEFVPLVHRHL